MANNVIPANNLINLATLKCNKADNINNVFEPIK